MIRLLFVLGLFLESISPVLTNLFLALFRYFGMKCHALAGVVAIFFLLNKFNQIEDRITFWR